MARTEDCSVKDLILSKTLGLSLTSQPEEKTYLTKPREYKYKVKRRKVLSPVEEFHEDRLNSEMASSLSVALLKSSGNFE
jgi:hypothetical protein